MIKELICLAIFLVILTSCDNAVKSMKEKPDVIEINDDSKVDDSEHQDNTDAEKVDDADNSDDSNVPDEAEDTNNVPDNDVLWDNCSKTFDCENDEMCVKKVGKCADTWGHCEKIPAECDNIDKPVCGCDGISYSNECESMSSLVNLKHYGKCE